MGGHRKTLPLWAANSLVFLFLFLAVIAWFFWQSHLLKQAFLNHAQQHAGIVAEVIRENAKGALASQQSIEDILQDLLENTARFVSFLDEIEPFDPAELTAFTLESGLEGISIIRNDRTVVHGPGNWKTDFSSLVCSADPMIRHFPDEKLYVLASPNKRSTGCLVLGINDEKIAVIQKRMGLENVIRNMSRVPGIRYIRINPPGKKPSESAVRNPVIINFQGEDVAESRQPVGDMELAVGVDAGQLAYFIKQLRLHLLLFSFCLLLAGAGLSLVLHRYQTAILNDVKYFERELSLEREDAALGRSAAAIAHEIRNPLNALSMGLQRLTLEKACTSEEHNRLIEQMRGAVLRANGSVTGLLNYARPTKPGIEKVTVASLVMDLLGLYRKSCETARIQVTHGLDFSGVIDSDPLLLGQAIENILKNAVEAQPGGGFIHCELKKQNKEVILLVKNKGCTLPPEESRRITEPYFTTRAEGTGLGMAIANTVVKALGGRIEIKILEGGVIETRIHLPLPENA